MKWPTPSISSESDPGPAALGDLLFPSGETEARPFADGERWVIAGALAQSQGNVTAAATLLGSAARPSTARSGAWD